MVCEPQNSIHVGLDVSPGFADLLSSIASKTNSTIDDVLLKSVALMAIAVDRKLEGKTIGFSEDPTQVTEITGI